RGARGYGRGGGGPVQDGCRAGDRCPRQGRGEGAGGRATAVRLLDHAGVEEGQPRDAQRLEALDLRAVPRGGQLAVQQRVQRHLLGDQVVRLVPQLLLLVARGADGGVGDRLSLGELRAVAPAVAGLGPHVV